MERRDRYLIEAASWASSSISPESGLDVYSCWHEQITAAAERCGAADALMAKSELSTETTCVVAIRGAAAVSIGSKPRRAHSSTVMPGWDSIRAPIEAGDTCFSAVAILEILITADANPLLSPCASSGSSLRITTPIRATLHPERHSIA